MPSIHNDLLDATFSISDKNSSGQFTITATISATRSTAGNPRLSCSLDDSSNWQRIGTSSLSAGASYSGSTTFSTGSTADGVVYIYLLSDYLSGIGGSYSVTGYVDPTPEMTPISISLSSSSATMGNSITVTESGGSYCSVSSREVLLNGTQIGNYSSGTWTINPDDFEPYCTTSNTMTVQLRAYCTHTSGATGSGYSNTVSLKMRVPTNYLPTCSHTATILNEVNGAIVGGRSGLTITLDPSVTPSANSATISSYLLYKINPVPTTDTVPVTTSNFTKSGYNFTCSTLPTKSGVPSYQFKMVFRVTDSRGNVLDYETDAYRVSNFVPPNVQITNLNRSTATTGSLSVTIEGESTSNPSRIDSSTDTIANVIVSDGTTSTTTNVKSNLVQTTKGYTLDYSITGLTSGSQYNVTMVYRDTTMVSYGESSYSYTQLLSTLAMPLSLYDNGSRMAVSFGEECADNYGYDTVINFAKDSYIRYIKDSVAKLIKVEDAFSQCPYNVGDIYITTLSSNPSTIWSGTTWTQLKNRFLLGAGSSYTAGTTGGEATHTLTISEMPAHSHVQQTPDWIKRGITEDEGATKGVGDDRCGFQTDVYSTASTGGDGAHNNMPPYLVVYMWKRTA